MDLDIREMTVASKEELQAKLEELKKDATYRQAVFVIHYGGELKSLENEQIPDDKIPDEMLNWLINVVEQRRGLVKEILEGRVKRKILYAVNNNGGIEHGTSSRVKGINEPI